MSHPPQYAGDTHRRYEPANQPKRSHLEVQQEPCFNDRLRTLNKMPQVKITPRRYQLELFKQALKSNCIIFLGTGLGKTFIVVQYLQDPQIARQIEDGKRAVFLAPTQDLIKQQAEYLSKQLPYNAKVFSGRSSRAGQHIDHWSKEAWADELQKVELLFMTPQIFSAAIQTNLLDWGRFCVVIFDEVHHACRTKKSKSSGHPYAQALNSYTNFYLTRPDYHRPRLIGLTASLLNNMPSNRDAIRLEVAHVERLLHGRCITDLAVQDKRPLMVIHSYPSNELHKVNDILTAILLDMTVSIKESLKYKENKKLRDYKPYNLTETDKKVLTFHNRLKLASTGISLKPGSFPKVLDALLLVRTRCGTWALKAICEKLIEPIKRHSENTSISTDIAPLYILFANLLTKIRDYISKFLSPSINVLEATRGKALALLDILKCEYQRSKLESRAAGVVFSCIVFVKSRLEVVSLTQWIQQVSNLPEYSFIKCDYAIGMAGASTSKYACITKRSPIAQRKMLENFRNGFLNVIVTTSVLEEGIDLPICSTVVRYDRANNFREFVQSRGRARQQDSAFIAMTEMTDSSLAKKALDTFYDFEVTIRDALSGEQYKPEVSKPKEPDSVVQHNVDTDFFSIDNNRVRITATAAKTILHIYTNRLSMKTPFIDGVRYERIKTVQGYRTILYLPSGCPLAGGVCGGVRESTQEADDSAVVAAVKALHEAKELDDNGVPTRITETNIDKLLDQSGLVPKLEPLDKSLEGIEPYNRDDDFRFFEPKVLRLEGNLSKDFPIRTYKLIKLHFEPISGQSRHDTKGFFQVPAYGLIVDSNTPCDMLPIQLYNHYGVMKVRQEVLQDNLSITRTVDHNEFLNFTHKVLFKVIGIKGVFKDDFRARCHFYLALLDKEDKPDISRMRQSFSGFHNDFQPGDIVKYRDIYSEGKERQLLMIVTKIHHELDARSVVPGLKMTFDEMAHRKFNNSVLNTLDQPAVELVPISRQFATTRAGRKLHEEYESRPIFILHQFLEHFDSSASTVIQSFNLPEIVYAIYNALSIADLNQKFLASTNLRAREMFIGKPENTTELRLAIEDTPMDTEEDKEAQEEDEDDDISDEDDVYSDSDSSYEEEDIMVGIDYNTLLTQNALDLNSLDDSDKMDKWDLDKYCVTDLKSQNYEYRYSLSTETEIEQQAKTSPIFSELSSRLMVDKEALVQRLKELEIKLVSDAWLVNENDQFQKRNAVVDKSIEPPLHFDRNAKPLLSGISRERAFLEALTHRKALQKYSLEGLENLGDTYLKYVVSVVLFSNVEGNEGFLTSARMRLVSNQHFTYLAKKHSLGSYAITRCFDRDLMAHALGKPLTTEQREIFNRLRPKDLADLFESLVGACLVYSGEFEAILAMDWLGLDIFKEGTFEELHEHAVVFSRLPSALIEPKGKEDNVFLDRYYKDMKSKLKRFEKILDYKFQDTSYLVQAFTHPSCPTRITRSYERLEFLGDAILDFLVTMTLAEASAGKFDPGQLSTSRSALVNNVAFAKVALTYKYDLFIQHFNDELYDELSKVRITLEEDPDLSSLDMADFDRVVKLLGDVFESVAGAIYLDSGCSLDTVWSIYYPMLKSSIDNELGDPTKNEVAMLHETFPGRNRIHFETYEYFEDAEPKIAVRCFVAGVGSFEGRGLSKRQAKKRAVTETIKNLPTAEIINRLNEQYKATHVRPRQNPNRTQRGRGRGGSRGGASRGGPSRGLRPKRRY